MWVVYRVVYSGKNKNIIHRKDITYKQTNLTTIKEPHETAKRNDRKTKKRPRGPCDSFCRSFCHSSSRFRAAL